MSSELDDDIHVFIDSVDSRNFGFIDLKAPFSSFQRDDRRESAPSSEDLRAVLLKGVAYYDHVVLKDPKVKPVVFCKLGHLNLLLEDFAKALSAYQKYFNSSDEYWKNPPCLYGLALVYFHFNALAWATKLFERVLEVDSKFVRYTDVHVRLGQIKKMSGDYSKSMEGLLRDAEVSYKELLQKPTLKSVIKSSVLRQLGWLYHTMASELGVSEDQVTKLNDMAVTFLKNALSVDAEDGQAWYFLGRVYSSLGCVQEAFQACKQSIDKVDLNANAWCSIGILYHQEEQWQDALQAYVCALQINPTLAAAWINLGLLYECHEQLKDALFCYRKAVETTDGPCQSVECRIPYIEAKLASVQPSDSKLQSISEVYTAPIKQHLNSSRQPLVGAPPPLLAAEHYKRLGFGQPSTTAQPVNGDAPDVQPAAVPPTKPPAVKKKEGAVAKKRINKSADGAAKPKKPKIDGTMLERPNGLVQHNVSTAAALASVSTSAPTHTSTAVPSVADATASLSTVSAQTTVATTPSSATGILNEMRADVAVSRSVSQPVSASSSIAVHHEAGRTAATNRKLTQHIAAKSRSPSTNTPSSLVMSVSKATPGSSLRRTQAVPPSSSSSVVNTIAHTPMSAPSSSVPWQHWHHMQRSSALAAQTNAMQMNGQLQPFASAGMTNHLRPLFGGVGQVPFGLSPMAEMQWYQQQQQQQQQRLMQLRNMGYLGYPGHHSSMGHVDLDVSMLRGVPQRPVGMPLPGAMMHPHQQQQLQQHQLHQLLREQQQLQALHQLQAAQHHQQQQAEHQSQPHHHQLPQQQQLQLQQQAHHQHVPLQRRPSLGGLGPADLANSRLSHDDPGKSILTPVTESATVPLPNGFSSLPPHPSMPMFSPPPEKVQLQTSNLHPRYLSREDSDSSAIRQELFDREYMRHTPRLAPPKPPSEPPETLHPEVPCVTIETRQEADSTELQSICLSHYHPIVLVKGLPRACQLDLTLFQSRHLTEQCREHPLEVRTQRHHPSHENWDQTGRRKVWRYESSRSSTSIGRYAEYQLQSQLEALQESQERKLDEMIAAQQKAQGGLEKVPKKSTKKCSAPKQVKFGTNGDLSDETKFASQLTELRKLPEFCKVSSPENMLCHVGHTILGMNSVQLYMKVPGCRTPGHQENNNFCSVNINVGPGDCEWFAVANCYWGVIHRLCEKKKLNFLTGSWWPNINDLEEHGVPVYRFIQKAGELVWVNTGCVHWVQSLGWCNNIAWNVGPISAHQYRVAMERYDWNKLHATKSIVPMRHVSWNLARSVPVRDPDLYKQIRDLLEKDMKSVLNSLQRLEEQNQNVVWHGREKDEVSYYCRNCETEVFDLLFTTKRDEEHIVFCETCARQNDEKLESFTVLQQFETQDLQSVLEHFHVQPPPQPNMVSPLHIVGPGTNSSLPMNHTNQAVTVEGRLPTWPPAQTV